MDYTDLRQWLSKTYPEYPFQQLGTSGATLLFEVLNHSGRSKLIIPAFICCELSFMAVKAGKQLVHIDVDANTLHMNHDQLKSALCESEDSDTSVLIDHSFGYPCSWIESLCREHSDLLIIEDCV